MLDNPITAEIQKRLPDAIAASILAAVLWLSRKKVWSWGYQLQEKEKQVEEIRAECAKQLLEARALAAEYKKERDEWKTLYIEVERDANSLEQRLDRFLALVAEKKL